MSAADATIFAFVCLACIATVRNELVFRARMRALDIVHEGGWQAQDSAAYFAQSYEAMVFDLTKWTFRQFYPTLAIKEVA